MPSGRFFERSRAQMNEYRGRVSAGFDYVLVLEWLRTDDKPTGTDLHAFLPSIGVASELRICQSWEDVGRALSDAAATVDTKGVPAVHLETHGSNPWDSNPEDIALGPRRDSGWNEFGPLLAPLNVRAGFRLLFVSAACWGSGIMAAINGGEHPAPFCCAVGFRTKVDEMAVRDSMRELYRSLKRGATVNDSVDSAQRELVAGQKLQLEIAVEIAVKILRVTYYKPEALRRTTVGPLRRRRRARRVWETWFPIYLRDLDPAYRFEIAIPE